MATRGAKPKLTPKVHKEIVRLLEAGNYATTACRANGIANATYYDWLKSGRDEVDEDGAVIKRAPARYRKFREDVEQASAVAETALVETVKMSSAKGALEILKRRYRSNWGDRVEMTGADGQPLQPSTIAPVINIRMEAPAKAKENPTAEEWMEEAGG